MDSGHPALLGLLGNKDVLQILNLNFRKSSAIRYQGTLAPSPLTALCHLAGEVPGDLGSAWNLLCLGQTHPISPPPIPTPSILTAEKREMHALCLAFRKSHTVFPCFGAFHTWASMPSAQGQNGLNHHLSPQAKGMSVCLSTRSRAP